MGIPLDAIQAKLFPCKYQETKESIYPSQIQSDYSIVDNTILVEFCVRSPYSGHAELIPFCALDEGLKSKDELVKKIKEVLTPFNIQVS
jgi:hypothetical protein